MVGLEHGVFGTDVIMVSVFNKELRSVNRFNNMTKKRVPWSLTFSDRSMCEILRSLGGPRRGLGATFLANKKAIRPYGIHTSPSTVTL
jgi:hypothetical protein